MRDLLEIFLFLAVWTALQRWVFPRLGVPT
jgi:hypothetical protein